MEKIEGCNACEQMVQPIPCEKHMEEQKEKRCGVCGKGGYLRGVSGNHAICEDCAKEALAEDLIVEDSDGLLYTYKEDKVNWQYEKSICARCGKPVDKDDPNGLKVEDVFPKGNVYFVHNECLGRK